ncbi:MAG: hypothetical protein BGO01_02695 [Armatimonadetes bacterium 55-13]|nr:MAG: hypothetical protein BGO01_02695 [Armatimonadetes bacterium 55-13]
MKLKKLFHSIRISFWTIFQPIQLKANLFEHSIAVRPFGIDPTGMWCLRKDNDRQKCNGRHRNQSFHVHAP